MQIELKAAYTLISDFKRGVIAQESEISAEHERLIRLLSEDLEVSGDTADIEQLVRLVAKVDSLWNKRTMTVIDRFYTARDAGNLVDAERERTAFIQQCPSVWYCGIVSSL